MTDESSEGRPKNVNEAVQKRMIDSIKNEGGKANLGILIRQDTPTPIGDTLKANTEESLKTTNRKPDY